MTTSGPSFEELFGGAAEIVASAPGRVNLIGEHTDYNGGYVLPIAIPQRTEVELRRRADRRARVASANVGAGAPVEFALGAERKTGTWIDYVQGVVWALAERGLPVGGFDARVRSDVPVGAGLSSSAALEVALLRGLRELFTLSIDDLDLAKAAQRGENEIVGAPVGILDPMACHLADEHGALFLDTRTLAFERVPLPERAELVIVDSSVRHDNISGDYRTRRAECARAASMLGVPELRDVDESRMADIERLPEPLGRRARHVVRENARVLAAVDAMRAGDLTKLGALFYASHASMRDDFEVSVPAVDGLVEAARAEPGVFGARLTGGGFGGAVIALVESGAGRAVAARMAAAVPGARVLVPGGGGP
jgi:galactokinase